MAAKEKTEKLIKLVLLGDSGVGKTSIVHRFAEGRFNEDNVSTIGVSYFEKTTDFGDINAKFQVWDTAGQETYRSLASLYYRGAHATIIVYDITRMDSLKGARFWIREMRKHEPNVCMALCGNKCDLEDARQISRAMGENFAKDNAMHFFEASAKTAVGVNDVFERLARKVNVGKRSAALPSLTVSKGKKKPCCGGS